jgi:hypothetical protein
MSHIAWSWLCGGLSVTFLACAGGYLDWLRDQR